MRPSNFYKQTLKRFSNMQMKNRTREVAYVELRRAIALVEFLMPARRQSHRPS